MVLAEKENALSALLEHGSLAQLESKLHDLEQELSKAIDNPDNTNLETMAAKVRRLREQRAAFDPSQFEANCKLYGQLSAHRAEANTIAAEAFAIFVKAVQEEQQREKRMMAVYSLLTGQLQHQELSKQYHEAWREANAQVNADNQGMAKAFIDRCGQFPAKIINAVSSWNINQK